MPPRASKPKRTFDTSALRDIPFMLFTSSSLFGFVGLYIPFFYVQLYSIQKIRAQKGLVPYFLPLLNAGSFFGRIVSVVEAGYGKKTDIF